MKLFAALALILLAVVGFLLLVPSDETAPTVEVAEPAPPATPPEPPASPVRPRVEQPPPAPGPHGRCLELGTDVPVPGIRLQLRTRAGIVGTTVADETGAFRFPPAGGDRTWLDTLLPEGWVRPGERRSLTAEERAGDALVVVHLARETSAPVRGRAVDEVTREPVPWCLVRITGPGGYEECRSGADGVFRSAGAHAAGEVELDFREPRLEIERDGTPTRSWLRLWAVDRDHVPGRDLGDVPVPIGPTYRVAIPDSFAAGEAGSPPWFFRLVERTDPPEVSGILWIDARGRLELEPPGEAIARVWEATHLRRDGDSTWVRFPVVQYEPQPGLDAYLECVHRDAYGRGAVRGTVGIQPDPVEPWLVPNAEVLGRVTAGGVIDPPNLYLRLLPDYAAGVGAQIPDWFGHGTTVEGAFRLETVVVGSYTLVAEAPGYAVHVERVDLSRGRNVLPTIDLAPSDRDTLVVRVEDDAKERLAVLLPRYSEPIGLGGASIGQGEYAFSGLADGPFRLVLLSDDGEYGSFAVGAGSNVALRAGALDTVPLRFDWGDRRDVTAVHDYGGVLSREEAPRQLVRRRWTPASDGPHRVRLWRATRRPVDLDVDGATFGAPQVDVAFEPGWGAVLHLRLYTEEARRQAKLLTSVLSADVALQTDEPTRRMLLGSPVPGARVWTDLGAESVSDANGTAVLSSADRPGAIRVDRYGWRVLRLERLGDGPANEYVVWMLPERQLPDHY